MNNIATDNFKNFPARMADGRAFTDYGPSCLKNKKLSDKKDSYEYRQNLINNTNNILIEQKKILENNYSCDNCNKSIIPSEMFVQSCSKGYCYIDKISRDGIGIKQA
jgi:hypothetical protein